MKESRRQKKYLADKRRVPFAFSGSLTAKRMQV
jgi:hypothetical protein